MLVIILNLSSNVSASRQHSSYDYHQYLICLFRFTEEKNQEYATTNQPIPYFHTNLEPQSPS